MSKDTNVKDKLLYFWWEDIGLCVQDVGGISENIFLKNDMLVEEMVDFMML